MAYPRIETAQEWITMGYDADLNKAWNDAKTETLKLLGEQRNLSAQQAQSVMASASDCRISQVVNIKKGIHCLNPKTGSRAIAERPTSETSAFLVTHAVDPDLNRAMDSASMAMIKLLQEKKQLARLDAYGLASMTMDCRLGEMSDTGKNVHCVVPKNLWVN